MNVPEISHVSLYCDRVINSFTCSLFAWTLKAQRHRPSNFAAKWC